MNWPGGAATALTLSFDDGYAATCASTAERLQARNLSATYNVITGRVGADFEGLATAAWADWRAARAMGHEIAAHGVSHAPLAGPAGDLRRALHNCLASPEPLAAARRILVGRAALWRARRNAAPPADSRIRASRMAELARSRRAVEAALGTAPQSFVYPAGRHDRASRQAARAAGFTSARGLDWGINGLHTDRFALQAIAVGPAVALSELAPWHARAHACGGWLIVVFHLVADRPPANYPYACPVDDFERWLDGAQGSSVWIAPQGEVIRRLAGQDGEE